MDEDIMNENNNVSSSLQETFEPRTKSSASMTINASPASMNSTIPVYVVSNSSSNSLHRTVLSTDTFMSMKETGFLNGCWKRKDVTKREKVLSISLILSCLLIVILVTSLSVIVLHPKCLHWVSSSLSWQRTCLSPVCVSAAADILKRIDKRVDPCTDFYKFSCGGLDNKLNPIPDDKSSISTAALLQLDIDKKIRGEFPSSLHTLPLPSKTNVNGIL